MKQSSDIDKTATPSMGATTLLEVLEELREIGYSGQLIPQPRSQVRCAGCGSSSDADTLVVAGYRRIEGASDAADLNMVTWQCCPNCGIGTSLIIGYGPNATASDAGVLERLSLGAAQSPGSTPSERP